MGFDFVSVTELSGDDASFEQVARLANRYYWALPYCEGKEVLEVACGTVQGIGYLGKFSKKIVAGDYSAEILSIAKKWYGERFAFIRLDGGNLPFFEKSFDVVILFEAIYYLESPERFISECRRILRRGGEILIATANKDLYDFNPSPHSYKYYGVVELRKLFEENGFSVTFFGNTPTDKISIMQKLTRPIKAFMAKTGLMPRTWSGKKLLKRLVFGRLIKMPPEVTEETAPYEEPNAILPDFPDRKHKVIYCHAKMRSE